VLSESQAFWVDTDLDKEKIDADKEVAKGLIRYNTLIYSFADSHLGDLSAATDLHMSIEQAEHGIAHFAEFFMALILGIDEVLDFTHGELSNPKQASAGRDFVSEGTTDLSRCKRYTTIVEFEKAGEVEEVALSGFWPEVTCTTCINIPDTWIESGFTQDAGLWDRYCWQTSD
jgi:hypothetical protein